MRNDGSNQTIHNFCLHLAWPLVYLLKQSVCLWLGRDKQGCKAKSLLVVIPIFHSFSSLLCGIILWTRSDHCPFLFLLFFISYPCQFPLCSSAHNQMQRWIPCSRAQGDGNTDTSTSAKFTASAVLLLTWNVVQFMKGDITLKFIHVRPSSTRGCPELAC